MENFIFYAASLLQYIFSRALLLTKGEVFTLKNDFIIYGIYSTRTTSFTILWPGTFPCHIHSIIFCWRMVDKWRTRASQNIFLFLCIYFYDISNQLPIYKLCYSINRKLQRLSIRNWNDRVISGFDTYRINYTLDWEFGKTLLEVSYSLSP